MEPLKGAGEKRARESVPSLWPARSRLAAIVRAEFLAPKTETPHDAKPTATSIAGNLLKPTDDRRKCQTPVASPAKPGELPIGLELQGAAPSRTS